LLIFRGPLLLNEPINNPLAG